MISNYCECGCGKECNRRFVSGHNRRNKHHKISGRKPMSEVTRLKISTSLIGNKNGLGHSVSDAMKRKLSLLYKGIELSEEAKQKMSLAKIGVKLSEETKKRISLGNKGTLGGFKKGCIPFNKGLTKFTNSSLARMSLSRIDFYANGGGLVYSRPGFYASDLSHWVRSMWEANFARWMKDHGIEYTYESRRFRLSNGRVYVPDFYIPSINMYCEVKGSYYGMTNLDKPRLFIEDKLGDLFVIGKVEYKRIEQISKGLVKNWGLRY